MRDSCQCTEVKVSSSFISDYGVKLILSRQSKRGTALARICDDFPESKLSSCIRPDERTQSLSLGQSIAIQGHVVDLDIAALLRAPYFRIENMCMPCAS